MDRDRGGIHAAGRRGCADCRVLRTDDRTANLGLESDWAAYPGGPRIRPVLFGPAYLPQRAPARCKAGERSEPPRIGDVARIVAVENIRPIAPKEKRIDPTRRRSR